MNNFKNIDELINGDIKASINFIYGILASDPYYTEELGSLMLVAEQTLQVISMFAKHDENNPILTKFNDKVFFKAGSQVLEENGLFIGTIKYAAHFVTGKTGDNNHRSLDKSKARHLGLLYDCIHDPEKRIVEDKDGIKKIYYTKNYILDNKKEKRFVSLFFVEIDMDGHIRYITIMPDKSINWGDNKKSGGFLIAPPQSFLLSTNPSIKDAQVREISSKAIEHTNTKESTTNIQHNIESLIHKIKLYCSDNQEVVNVIDSDCYERIQEDAIIESKKDRNMITIDDLNSMITQNNQEYGTKFEIKGAFGFHELWERNTGLRLDVGSLKDMETAFLKYKLDEKYRPSSTEYKRVLPDVYYGSFRIGILRKPYTIFSPMLTVHHLTKAGKRMFPKMTREKHDEEADKYWLLFHEVKGTYFDTLNMAFMSKFNRLPEPSDDLVPVIWSDELSIDDQKKLRNLFQGLGFGSRHP